ncbi:MAG: acyl transferase, partial [Bacteroidota bacterium]|nr:acyl transferase [Bacteroidota bacterium]
MNILKSFKKEIFSINDSNFNHRAIELFNFQAQHNEVYKKYLKYLKINHNHINKIEKIPFLPIEFFKYHKIVSGKWHPATIFESSGTTNLFPSKHYIEDIEFYNLISSKIFNLFYGPPKNYHILALLPSYLERKNASLVAMIDCFIKESDSEISGFYLDNYEDLIKKVRKVQDQKNKSLLIGVTFALLDLAQEFSLDLSNFIVMETGGMKGRREELIRKEVHDILKKNLNLQNVHSEYGMTELLSQAYATEEGQFKTP